MWLLSASQRSAKLAATQGMGYTLGTFLLPSQDKIDAAKASVETYREHFQQTALNMSPTVMLTTFAIVTDTEEEAQDLLHALDVATRQTSICRVRPLPIHRNSTTI